MQLLKGAHAQVISKRPSDWISSSITTPVLKLRKLLKSNKQKDKIKLITDDPAAIVDVPHFCNEQGHQILQSLKENDYDLFIIDRSKN